MCSKNNYLSSRFFIPKISLGNGTTILETPKTIKGNFSFFEKCRGAGRKV